MRHRPFPILGFVVLLWFTALAVSNAAKPFSKTPQPPPPLNAGEERMLADLTPLEKILLPNVTIDAPTVRQAFQKWLASVRSMPDGQNIRIKWKFLDERLAEAGPVHYFFPAREKDDESDLQPSIPAIDILINMLQLFDGVLWGNPDGSWGIARRRKERLPGGYIVQYKVPPEIFKPTLGAPNPKPQTEEYAADNGWGSLLPIQHLALYSSATNIVIVQGTILDHLRTRKALIEKWPMPKPTKGKRKQKNIER